MRRFLQSSSRNLPLLLGQTGHHHHHHQAAVGRQLKVIICRDSINQTSQRSISHQSSWVVFQANKTANGSSSGNNRNHNINNNDNDNNNDKPRRGGSSRMSPPGRRPPQADQEARQETSGQKLARTFGFQGETKRSSAGSTGERAAAKRTTGDRLEAASPPKRSAPATSSSPSSSGSASDRHRDKTMDEPRQNQQDARQQTNRRQSSSSSSSGRGADDTKVGPNHRASGAVRHDAKGRRFILHLGHSQLARIDYRPAEQTGVIELYHTEVPGELRGQGIGRQLARGAFECASEAGLRLKVTCDYLRDYVHRFAGPDHKRLLVGEQKGK